MSRCKFSRKCSSTTKPGKNRIQSLCAYAQTVPDGVSRKLWELLTKEYLEPISKERKLHFDLIRNKGNHDHDNEFLKVGSGTLIPSQQSGKLVKVSDYIQTVRLCLKENHYGGTCPGASFHENAAAQQSQAKIGSKLLCAYAQSVPDGVSRKLRELSRKAGRLKQIGDFYVPSNFNFVVEALKDVSGFDEDKNIYKIHPWL
ncbi:hypothetical protein N1851_017929 [Merluccius polli]|uniref:Uncharacterized protein n=1 Tax=Merluccius polli TaxID=89951 RepID=A0AA47MNX9_MERPO|nr:hypothetical protein N1851_017929 [Merluccius polli]